MQVIKKQVDRREWRVAGSMLAACWAVAGLTGMLTGDIAWLLILGYIGIIVGVGVGIWLALPRYKRHLGRQILARLIGPFLFVLAGLSAAGVIHSARGFPAGDNVQLEGFFFSLLSGTLTPAIVHYLLGKLVGPFLFGRVWCGWACWLGVVFDLLPFQRSPGRLPGKWGRLRYAHFGLSLGLVVFCWWTLGARDAAAWGGWQALAWFLGGSLLYYATGISLAFLLKDNRAFCKYVCPVAVPLKVTARFSALKVAGDKTKCDQEGACVKICPMDIRVTDYVQQGTRVLASECILCQECIAACPNQALALSFGRDQRGVDWLRQRAEDSTP